MNRKQFAAQKSANEKFPNIKALALQGLTSDNINAKNAILRDIFAIADQWVRDFGNCDPAWKPIREIQPIAVSEDTPKGARALCRSLGSYQNGSSQN